jgi:hypothetical protein
MKPKKPNQCQPRHLMFLPLSLSVLSHSVTSRSLSLVRSELLNFFISCILGTFYTWLISCWCHRTLSEHCWKTHLTTLPALWVRQPSALVQPVTLPLAAIKKCGGFFTRSSQWVKFLFQTCSKSLSDLWVGLDDI